MMQMSCFNPKYNHVCLNMNMNKTEVSGRSVMWSLGPFYAWLCWKPCPLGATASSPSSLQGNLLITLPTFLSFWPQPVFPIRSSAQTLVIPKGKRNVYVCMCVHVCMYVHVRVCVCMYPGKFIFVQLRNLFTLFHLIKWNRFLNCTKDSVGKYKL